MKKLLIAASILLILGLGGYLAFDQLGGNRPVELSLEAKSPDTLSGQTFRGTPQDKGMEQLFQKIQSTQKLHPGTKLHTIYYTEPAGKLDTLEVFAGINLPFGTQDLEVKKTDFQSSWKWRKGVCFLKIHVIFNKKETSFSVLYWAESKCWLGISW